MKGTYTLLIELVEPAVIEFGAKGVRTLDSGWFAYTGSAFGSGGFSRIDRHERVASGDLDVRHWHIDYLLGHPATRLVADVRTPDEDVECEVVRGIDAEPVAGIGASDCDCDTHLQFTPDRDTLVRMVRRAHDCVGR
ncbi:GIY-YIG nuclease family protein [Haladaptatus sp. NG-SE-30]